MPLPYGLIDPVELSLPGLPSRLEGLRIAHLSDLHIRRDGRGLDRLARQLTSQRLDMVVLTGDYIDKPGQEKAGLAVMQRLLAPLRPRLGLFGVFGNHDTPELHELFRQLPVRWLVDDYHVLEESGIELLGMHMLDTQLPDGMQVALRMAGSRDGQERPGEGGLRLMLSHSPVVLPTASDLGVDVVFCGHTHGGQCRLPTGHALVNSCDLPLGLTGGILRHRDTLASVSRGVGFTGWVPRIFCRGHVPVYTLRRRTMAGRFGHGIVNIKRW